jgi:dephospho-CoA kinase
MRLIVTGAPAAGKSTFIEAISRTLASRHGAAPPRVSIDGVLREMHERGELAGRAELSADGSLIIADFGSMARQVVDRLADVAHRAGSPVVIEVPLFDWSLTPGLAEMHTGAHVLVLSADLRVRIERNRTRAGQRISERGLVEMPDRLLPADARTLESVAASVRSLDTTEGDPVRHSTDWLRSIGALE